MSVTGDYGRIVDYLFATTGWLRLWEIYLTLWEAIGGLFDTMGELWELAETKEGCYAKWVCDKETGGYGIPMEASQEDYQYEQHQNTIGNSPICIIYDSLSYCPAKWVVIAYNRCVYWWFASYTGTEPTLYNTLGHSCFCWFSICWCIQWSRICIFRARMITSSWYRS